MIKITTLITALTLTFLQSFSQDSLKRETKQIELVSLEKSVTVLPILLPAIAHEIRVTPFTSLYFSFNTLLGGTLLEKENYLVVSFMPAIDLRRYYNLEQRAKDNKNITRNSGNYIALRLQHIFPRPSGSTKSVFEEINSTHFGIGWGIQRNYLSGVHLGFSIGPGFKIVGDQIRGSSMGEFKVGIQLGSKKD